MLQVLALMIEAYSNIIVGTIPIIIIIGDKTGYIYQVIDLLLLQPRLFQLHPLQLIYIDCIIESL
jgi:hypothetical protein